MSETLAKRIRLFPVLISFAAFALAVRIADVVTGVGLVTSPVIAQENQPENSQEMESEATDQNSVETESMSPSNEPLMIGVPSSEEMELITQLRQRREELDQRAVKLDLQEQLLAGTEKRINDKIEQLKVLETRIKGHLRLFDERESQQLQSIVAVYEKMKAKDAAPRFEALDLQTQMDLVSRMKPTKVADLMAKMSSTAASRLTTELATVAQPPNVDEIGGSQ